MTPRRFESTWELDRFYYVRAQQQNLITNVCQRLGAVAFRPNYHGDSKDANTVMCYFKEDEEYNRELDRKYEWLPDENMHKKPFFTFQNTDCNGMFDMNWANHGSIDLRSMLKWQEILEGAICLAFYKEKQRRYVRSCGGYGGIYEADDVYNDLNRDIMAAYLKFHQKAFLCNANYHDEAHERVVAGTQSVYEEYTGQKIYNADWTYIVPTEDEELQVLIRQWNSGNLKSPDPIEARVNKIGGEMFVWF